MSQRETRAACWSGVAATFVATIVGYWLPGIGLPRLDFAMLNGNLVVPESASASFAWAAGVVQNFGVGIVLAFVYVAYLRSRLPGPGWARGMIWGLVLGVVSGLTVLPLLYGAGVFGTTWSGATPMALTVWHLAWGGVLGTACELVLGE